MHDPVRGYVDYANGQLHYRRWGDARASECWVLLHQSASDSGTMAALGGELARNSSVLAFDTPGFGMSDPLDEFSVPRAASAIGEALVKLGVAHWNVFGHHTGAAIALALACSRPERVNVVVLSGLLLPQHGDRERMAVPLTPLPIDREGSHLASAWQRVTRYTPQATLESLTREAVSLLTAHDPHTVYDALLWYDPRPDLEKLSAPALVVCGADDHLAATAPAVAALAGRSRVVLIEGAGLDMHETHAAELARQMLARGTGG